MAAMSSAPISTATIPQPAEEDAQVWDFSANSKPEAFTSGNTSPRKEGRPSKSSTGDASNSYEFGFEPLPPSRKRTASDEVSASLRSNRSHDRANASHDASTKHNSDDVFSSRRPAHGAMRTKPDNIVEQWDDESSKWIHRDKLAKIESRELQAAGFFLPQSRASSKARRGRSEERSHSTKRNASSVRESSRPPVSRHNRDPSHAEEVLLDDQSPSWDLRLPEEIEAEGDGYWVCNGVNSNGSKIPVAKISPAPIPDHYIERHSPSSRKQSFSGEPDAIIYPKTRSRSSSANALAGPGTASGPITATRSKQRSATDLSPKKNAAPRKTSAPAKSPGRPKTRSGPNKDSTSSSNGPTRPSTRSGELSPTNKQPEGDPPWMIGSYKPDPRLPPDQQLLPTVARRLQQEKMEREGKFGSVYDKEFRPLTEDDLLRPPESRPNGTQDEEKPAQGQADEWPLRPENKTLGSRQGASYSTIPRISEKPPGSPLPSPRNPTTQPQPAVGEQDNKLAAAGGEEQKQQQEEQHKEKNEGGCGCCIVM